MRTIRRLIVVCCLAAVAGCASVTGTWVSEGGADPSKSPIARVTFCHDGTFTAEADYGGKEQHAMSGCYCVKGDKLCIMADGQKRMYPFSVSGDVLTIGEHKSQMKRLKGCPMGCCKSCCAKACAEGDDKGEKK
jgi:hypothetical protein